MNTSSPPSLHFGLSSAYRPIWIIYGLIFFTVTVGVLANGLGFEVWMRLTMGAVALVFALFKLFDLAAFARDFAGYVVVAKRVPFYGRAYPLIEAGLGVLFVAGVFVPFALLASVLVFGLGLIGVWQALQRGEKVQCACVGKMFDLPLSRVALFENGLMVGMSVLMLILMAAG